MLTTIGAVSLGVFALVCTLVGPQVGASREQRFEPPLPRAFTRVTRAATGARWLRGLGRQRLYACARRLQIGMIALGLTASFVTFVCTAIVMVAMLVGPL